MKLPRCLSAGEQIKMDGIREHPVKNKPVLERQTSHFFHMWNLHYIQALPCAHVSFFSCCCM